MSEARAGKELAFGKQRLIIMPLKVPQAVALKEQFELICAPKLAYLWGPEHYDALCQIVREMAEPNHPDVTAEMLKVELQELTVGQVNAIAMAVVGTI